MPRRVAPALLSGVLLALCLPKPGLSLLAWIGLAPLIFALSKRTPRQSLKLGWLAGFAFHGVAFYWIYSTCRFAAIPVPIALLAWGALAAFQGLAWAAAAVFGRWTTAALPERLKALGWAVAWTACAVVWERWTPRLPGDLLEYTQWRFLALLQIASIAGPHFLGFVIVLVNAGLAQAWKDRRNGVPALAAGTALAAGALLFGVRTLANRAPAAQTARVEILQPNIDQYQKWDERYSERITANFDKLLAAPRAAPPRLIVWPESALPRIINEREAPAEAAVWSRKTGAAQIVGAVTRDGSDYHNSVIMLGTDGAYAAAYHKRELVPFGEYVPFASLLRPWIGKLNELGGITSGRRLQPLLDTPLGLAAGSICYEAVFPRWARRDAARGARLIVNVTNDGWYKDTWGPHQHFQTNVFRAIENRVTVIRSGNTGISAVIDPWGATLGRLDLNARGRLDADAPLDDPFPARSFYSRHGDWFGLLCLAMAALLAGARLTARR